MLSLFQSIFARRDAKASGYPESLVEAAIERAVDGTDPRLRAMTGYRKRLRGPVLHAIDHVVRLVDGLPAPVATNMESYRDDPRLGAMFASPQRMFEVIANDGNLNATLCAASGRTDPVTALLVMQMTEKHTLGIDIEDDVLKRDVQQTIVSFDAHRLVDTLVEEAETRRALKRRAFDHLLMQVLEAIGKRRKTRQQLSGQREVLGRKLRTLQTAGWSFQAGDSASPDAAALEQKLAGIEAEINAFGADSATLEQHLKILAAALSAAEQQLWIEDRSLILDHCNVLRVQPDSVAREMRLQQLRSARGERVVLLLLSIDPALLPQKVDFFGAAKHYLNR